MTTQPQFINAQAISHCRSQSGPATFQRLSFALSNPMTEGVRLSRLSRSSGGGCICGRIPKMAIDPASVGTGYALLNSFKGVAIGPTVNEVVSAICGGTVGVMGTIIALEVRRQRVKERKQCPYCRGTGKLPCGACYSIGTIPSMTASSGQESCSICSSSGYLQCNHVSIKPIIYNLLCAHFRISGVANNHMDFTSTPHDKTPV